MYWIGIFNLLATIQAFIFSIIFLTQEQYRINRVLLSLLSAGFGLTIMGSVLAALGYYTLVPHLIRIGDPVVLALPPLIFLYTKRVCNRSLSKADLFHFLPFLVYVATLIPFYALPGSEKIAFIDQVFHARVLSPGLVIISVLRLILNATYIFLSLQLIRQTDTRLKETYSTISHVGLDTWQKILYSLGILVIFLVLLFILMVTHRLSFLEANIYNGFVVSLMLYLSVFFGWTSMRRKDKALSHVPANSPGPAEEIPGISDPAPKPQGGGLGKESLEQYAVSLAAFMSEKKSFTNPDLTLPMLAGEFGISTHLLSQVINQQFNQNFFDFVNAYRVKEVIELMKDPDNRPFTLLSLAFEAGFNSKSTFNLAFKKHTGQTPSKFKESVNQ